MATLQQLIESARESTTFIRSRFLKKRDMELTRELARLREQKGLKQKELAELLGVSQQAVSKMEKYDWDPRLSMLRRYSNAIGVVVLHEIVDDTDNRLSSIDEWTTGSGQTTRISVPRRSSHQELKATRSPNNYEEALKAKRTDFALAG